MAGVTVCGAWENKDMDRKRTGLVSIGTHTLRAFVPEELRDLPQLQTDLPRIAKDRRPVVGP